MTCSQQERVQVAADSFHDHLDFCQQCREQPFNLCQKGMIMLNHFGDIAALTCSRTILGRKEPS